jgi:hypothetical protein
VWPDLCTVKWLASTPKPVCEQQWEDKTTGCKTCFKTIRTFASGHRPTFNPEGGFMDEHEIHYHPLYLLVLLLLSEATGHL